MGLSCSCDYEWDGDGWCYTGDTHYAPLARKRSVKCCSCGAKIAPGEMAMAHHRMRAASNDTEERIHGDEVPMAPWWHCERCADLYLSLTELGYCVGPHDDQRELVREYAEMKQSERWAAADRRLALTEAPMLGCLDARRADP